MGRTPHSPHKYTFYLGQGKKETGQHKERPTRWETFRHGKQRASWTTGHFKLVPMLWEGGSRRRVGKKVVPSRRNSICKGPKCRKSSLKKLTVAGAGDWGEMPDRVGKTDRRQANTWSPEYVLALCSLTTMMWAALIHPTLPVMKDRNL
jgi:hypothetical protein